MSLSFSNSGRTLVLVRVKGHTHTTGGFAGRLARRPGGPRAVGPRFAAAQTARPALALPDGDFVARGTADLPAGQEPRVKRT